MRITLSVAAFVLLSCAPIFLLGQQYNSWKSDEVFEYKIYPCDSRIHLSCEIEKEIAYGGKHISWRIINVSDVPVNVKIEVQYNLSCDKNPIKGTIQNKRPIQPGYENHIKDDIDGTNPSTLGFGFRKEIQECKDDIELKSIEILKCSIIPLAESKSAQPMAASEITQPASKISDPPATIEKNQSASAARVKSDQKAAEEAEKNLQKENEKKLKEEQESLARSRKEEEKKAKETAEKEKKEKDESKKQKDLSDKKLKEQQAREQKAAQENAKAEARKKAEEVKKAAKLKSAEDKAQAKAIKDQDAQKQKEAKEAEKKSTAEKSKQPDPKKPSDKKTETSKKEIKEPVKPDQNAAASGTATPVSSGNELPLAAENNNATPSPANDPDSRLVFSDDMLTVYGKDFEDKAFNKIQELNLKIKVLSTQISETEAIRIIDQTVNLFINEDAIVQVSSVNSEEKRSYVIRTYLKKIRALPYEKIFVEWSEFFLATNFKKMPDGNYSGVVSFQQRFKGLRDEQIIYEDVTQKKIEVIIKVREKMVAGEKHIAWEVLLGDIGVVQTSKS